MIVDMDAAPHCHRFMACLSSEIQQSMARHLHQWPTLALYLLLYLQIYPVSAFRFFTTMLTGGRLMLRGNGLGGRTKNTNSQRRRSGSTFAYVFFTRAIMAGSSVAFTGIEIPRIGWQAGKMGFRATGMVYCLQILAWPECARITRQLVFFRKTFSSIPAMFEIFNRVTCRLPTQAILQCDLDLDLDRRSTEYLSQPH